MRYTTDLMKEILQSAEARKIVDYISPIYGESYIGLWLLEAIGTELDKAALWTEDILKQVSPDSATWSMYYYAQSYGVKSDPDLLKIPPGKPKEDLDQGVSAKLELTRQEVLNKLSERAPFYPGRIENMVLTLTGKEAKLAERAGENTFDLKFVGFVSALILQDLYKLLDQVKPAHLYANYLTKLNIGELMNYTYGALKKYTYNEIVSLIPVNRI